MNRHHAGVAEIPKKTPHIPGLRDSEKASILLVDDRPENLLALEEMLSGLGQHVVKANSGSQALKHALDQDFAVILLDIMMPGIDGFEIASLIKGRERSKHTPIVFITAIDPSEEQVFKGYALGAADYLFKPIVPEILRAKVTAFIDLYQKTNKVKRQAEHIETANQELAYQLREIRRLNWELEQTNRLLETEIAERQHAQEALQQSIADLKETEYALREMNEHLEVLVKERTAELKASNDELSTFTHIVSHDLRSPLINLKGFTGELHAALAVIPTNASDFAHLDESQTSALTQAVKNDIPEAMGFIEAAVERMDDLTSALLRLARLGRRELNIELVDMAALVQVLVDSLAYQIKQKEVRVKVGYLPSVLADRTAMTQIMGNILTNAVLYLKPDHPGEIEIMGEATGYDTTFFVRDNGRGIAEEERHKVFEPFRRCGIQDVAGEGMALAYVQVLLRRHGGRIWFNSKPDMGTTFFFSIPNSFPG
ncbi:MAG: response regulator [Chloroflexi bacterium]|nr:response regulator [Chloroflexota bacterium]